LGTLEFFLGHFESPAVSVTASGVAPNTEPTTGLEPVTSSLPRKCSTTELGGRWLRGKFDRFLSLKRREREKRRSGRPGSNRRRSAWKADALPTELLPRERPQ